MIDRSIVVFSGVQPRVVEKIAPTLRSMGMEPVTVTLYSSPTSEYFERLAKQALYAASKSAAKGDVRISSVLISSLDGTELEAETRAFFPALRRVPVRSEWSNNPAAAKQIASVVQDYFKANSSREFIRNLAATREQRMLLPFKNTPSKALMDRFKEIYACRENDVGKRVNKEVVVQRAGRGMKIRDLNFVLALNGEQHPVRRCTETSCCDLQASFRFGVAVAARLEFDVTAENGLKSKKFQLCDSTVTSIGRQATHLNMRINDDFKEG